MAKQKAKITFSEYTGKDEKGDDQYQNHKNFNDSVTGVHVHRNDDTAKSFKKTVEAVASKLEEFNVEKQNSKYALLVRPSGVTAEEFLDSDVPF